MASLQNILRYQNTLLNALKICEGINLNQVRFRKPRMFPKAKTKIFKVRVKPEFDPEETVRINAWNAVYSTEMKSLR